jgi:hypothetical protein
LMAGSLQLYSKLGRSGSLKNKGWAVQTSSA